MGAVFLALQLPFHQFPEGLGVGAVSWRAITFLSLTAIGLAGAPRSARPRLLPTQLCHDGFERPLVGGEGEKEVLVGGADVGKALIGL